MLSGYFNDACVMFPPILLSPVMQFVFMVVTSHFCEQDTYVVYALILILFVKLIECHYLSLVLTEKQTNHSHTLVGLSSITKKGEIESI
jgi:hypothetical protein